MTRQPSGWRRRTGASVLLLLSPLLSVVGWTSSADAVPACTIYWTGGAGDHDWANTSNWSTNRLSDGTDSAPLPGETARVCVAVNPVSRGAVIDGIDDDVYVDSIRFPAVADSLTVTGTPQNGSGNFGIGPRCCDLPAVKRASTIGSLTIDGRTVTTLQPLTVAGPVRIDAEGMFKSAGWDGTYKTRFRSEVDVTKGVIDGDVILLGHTTFGSLVAGGGVLNRGTMTGAPFCILWDANGDYPKVHPSVINEGTITGSGEPDSYCALDMVANRGTIRGTGGELYVSSPDFVHHVLTGGRYEVTAGVLGFEDPVFENEAILRSRGDGRFVNYGGLPTLQYLARNSGTLDLANDVTDDVDLVNTGTVVLRSATLAARSYSQTDGSTRLLARSRIAADANVGGGSLGAEGNGFVDGDLALGPDATTKVQVRPSGADRLTVSGAASLDGRLLVANAGSFEPGASASYRFLAAGSRTGAFSSVQGETVTSRTYGVEYQADGARLITSP